VLLRQIEKRFGVIRACVKEQLEDMPLADLESTALRLLDAGTLEELLRNQAFARSLCCLTA
jgi:hypothetical protein